MAQCQSCRFENMPQYQTCVRCGSILPGSNAPIGIEPPRAGKLEKSLRLASVIRTINRCTGTIIGGIAWAWQTIRPHLQLQIRSADLTILGMFWKGIIPGLPQWYFDRKPHDKIFFFGWLTLLLLSFLTFGLPISGILFGLAISLHLCSIIDIAIITSPLNRDRFFLFCICVIGAIFLLYIPARTLTGNHFNAHTVGITVGPLQRGDGLLYTRSWRTITPKVGDVVLYRVPGARVQQGGDVIIFLGANLFDRVLALEGQTVSWEDGQLFVDGVPSPYQPVDPTNLPPNTTFVVPEGQCYIHLSMPLGNWGIPDEILRSMPLVPYKSIYGTVWGVRRSLFRFVDINEGGTGQ